MMGALLHKLSAASRSRDWRLSLLPFIMGCVYLWLWHFHLPFDGRVLMLVLLSLATAAGFASLGYFINEFFDQRHDALAGKANRIAPLRAGQRLVILLTASVAAFAPWIWLPADGLSWVLIAVQVGLFLLYSLPFPRLKAIPLASNLVDMGYAYLVPLLLSFRTYMLFAGGEVPIWLWPLMVSVGLIGLRNILIHQVNDLFNDRLAGMQTLPQWLGPHLTSATVLMLLLTEVAAFSMFCVIMAFGNSLFWVLALAYFMFLFVRAIHQRKHFSLRLLPLTPARQLTDLFYQTLLPPVALMLLAASDGRWAVLVPLHGALLVPWFVFVEVFQGLRVLYWRIRALASACVNFPIFYVFRLFGADLRKEKMSAIQFLRSRF